MLAYLRQDSSIPVEIQDTDFTKDLLARYVCNTLDEAVNNGGAPFDLVVNGGGMFAAYTADKVYCNSADLNLRILLLDAGSFLLPTHVQNLPHPGLNPPEVAHRPITRSPPDRGATRPRSRLQISDSRRYV
jgi:hypothetical protein